MQNVKFFLTSLVSDEDDEVMQYPKINEILMIGSGVLMFLGVGFKLFDMI